MGLAGNFAHNSRVLAAVSRQDYECFCQTGSSNCQFPSKLADTQNDCFFLRIPNFSCSSCLDSHSIISAEFNKLSNKFLAKCVYERFLLLNKKSEDSNIGVTDQVLQNHLSWFLNWRSHFRSENKGIPKGSSELNGLWTRFHCHPPQAIAKGGSKCQGEGRAKKGCDREDMEIINFMLKTSGLGGRSSKLSWPISDFLFRKNGSLHVDADFPAEVIKWIQMVTPRDNYRLQP